MKRLTAYRMGTTVIKSIYDDVEERQHQQVSETNN